MAQRPDSLNYTKEFGQVCDAIAAGSSVIVLGEAGSGAGEFAQALGDRFGSEYQYAIAVYKGSLKLFFKALCRQWDCPTETEDEKPMTVDQMKDELLMNCSDNCLLIFPEARRLTVGIRYWLEDAIGAGVRVVCFAPMNPGRDIFLDMIEVEMELPSDRAIREVMEHEAKRHGLRLTESQFAGLQPLAGRNPMLAKKVIRNEALGLKQKKPEHSQYLDISPLVLAVVCLISLLRFIGLGTGDRGLYIVGGVAMVLSLSLKYLGKIQGAKKRYGQ